MGIGNLWGDPLGRYEIKEAKSEKIWTLTLFSHLLRLEHSGEVHDLFRSELPEKVQLVDGRALLVRTLIVTLRKNKVIFTLSPEVFAVVKDWIGPPTQADLMVALKRRFCWVLPIGILFIVTSVPIGDLPWDPVTFGLGVMLLATGLLARWKPHRILFAVDALWFAILAGNSAWLLQQQWSWWQFALSALQLALVYSGWKEFRRFSSSMMAASSPR